MSMIAWCINPSKALGGLPTTFEIMKFSLLWFPCNHWLMHLRTRQFAHWYPELYYPIWTWFPEALWDRWVGFSIPPLLMREIRNTGCWVTGQRRQNTAWASYFQAQFLTVCTSSWCLLGATLFSSINIMLYLLKMSFQTLPLRTPLFLLHLPRAQLYTVTPASRGSQGPPSSSTSLSCLTSPHLKNMGPIHSGNQQMSLVSCPIATV